MYRYHIHTYMYTTCRTLLLLLLLHITYYTCNYYDLIYRTCINIIYLFFYNGLLKYKNKK